MFLDSDILIIGGGMSGIGAAVQLIRTYDSYNFEIIEQSDNVGGTWWLNSYPGCGCDVPSHFYSFSFALNPSWSRVYSWQPEIQEYFQNIARRYNILSRVRFNTFVRSASWDTDSATWSVEIEDLQSRMTSHRRCKILISAVGALSIPQTCKISGVDRFQGRMFHSARWDHSFDWKGKDIVVVGNGCSATQFVPILTRGENAAKRVAQFSRQAHWLAERVNPEYSSVFKWTMKWVPGAMRLYRAWLYWEKEMGFRAFNIERGKRLREAWARDAAAYIRAAAPERYREALIPKSVFGCKRRVNDTGYLACLHHDNMELIHDDPIHSISETEVVTASGRRIKADAIVLATGFQTQKLLSPMQIRGENGILLTEHWEKVSSGTPSAYYGTCVAGFPNFFMMMGPNTVTGHLSVIFTVECQINFVMRIIKPIMGHLRTLRRPRQNRQNLRGPESVVVIPEAELEDNRWIQNKCKELVWSTGCTSWFVDAKSGRNTQMYPDWQFLYWARSFLIPSQHFCYRPGKPQPEASGLTSKVLLGSVLLCGFIYLRYHGDVGLQNRFWI